MSYNVRSLQLGTVRSEEFRLIIHYQQISLKKNLFHSSFFTNFYFLHVSLFILYKMDLLYLYHFQLFPSGISKTILLVWFNGTL